MVSESLDQARLDGIARALSVQAELRSEGKTIEPFMDKLTRVPLREEPRITRIIVVEEPNDKKV